MEELNKSKRLYGPILALCNLNVLSLNRYVFAGGHEYLHNNLVMLSYQDADLINLLCAFSRSMPSLEDEVTREYCEGQFRERDRIDDAIVALRGMRVSTLTSPDRIRI